MEQLWLILHWLEEQLENGVSSYQRWQIVAATATLTLAVYTTRNLYHNRQDVWESIRKWSFKMVRTIPSVNRRISERIDEARSEIERAIYKNTGGDSSRVPLMALPPTGWTRDQVLQAASTLLSEGRYEWQDGKMSGGTFSGDNAAYNSLMEQMFGLFALSNPLHADVFPGVMKMEAEIVRMTISLFHGTDNHCGSLTSGGSESILMAVKAMRDWGREVRGIEQAEIVGCVTVHAGFDKAADLLGMKLRKVDMDPKTCKVNLSAMQRAINSNTVMLVASAPQFPHGIIDDVEEIGALGQRYNVPVHVDCCMGGFILPFMEAAGYPLPLFDFRVPGVTSISADTHKYGNAPKGSSVIMYQSAEHRHYQYFVVPDWPGGIYGSPTIPGSRPGGLVAVCWAALLYHGFTGYTQATQKIITTARNIKRLLKDDPSIQVFGDPLASIVAFGSKEVDIYKVGDTLGQHGWHLNFLQYPPGIHICLTTLQVADDFAGRFVHAVKEAIEQVRLEPKGMASLGKLYGTVASIPDKSLVGEAAKVFLTCYYKTETVRRDEETENLGDRDQETAKRI
nr:sphingosine-1-phosphate lyase-like [Cherax quadricarinatus]